MRSLRDSLTTLIVLTLLVGVLYPLAVTGIGQALWPREANGSLVTLEGRIVGSELIGQPFESPGYFWSRRSATSVHPYNAGISSGSNQGPLHPDLAAAVTDRVAALRAAPGADPGAPVPVDLVTASGSGLDPHISPAAAFYQVGRVAAARGVASQEIEALVKQRVEPQQLGFLGEPRVNVLLLNLDLDARFGRVEAPSEKGDSR